MIEPGQDWRDILRREWYHCGDKDYARRLYRAVFGGPFGWFNRISRALAHLSRPYAGEVEAALRQGCVEGRGARDVWERRLERLDQSLSKDIPVAKLIMNLQDHHWLERFVARHILLHRGGEVIEPLHQLALDESALVQPTALWLLQSIATDTTLRLAPEADNLLCPRCLVYCQAQPISLPRQPDLTFYGCRVCRQSQSFHPRPANLIVVLDKGMPVEQLEQDQCLRVNWLRRHSLFDFDEVEIVRASDEEVERFAVQIGNDTDPVRKPRYAQMRCDVSPECQLSQNTLRILESMFGQVITHAPQL